ncbi:MAG: hypothetical protein ING72_13680 [Methylobacterium sp.]|nr:hypothetical protein [Methylobacterium sp.]MCA3603785.1 hypothetical protein [Methylobacterium sp.]MCA3615339.1 hypothetical protein [Methylobacterium sp.]MCA4911384.1 hypothetical protein [Methylobacterium sp.]
MSENMNDAMPIILRKIQEEIADFRHSTDTRLAVLEDLVRKQRRDTAGLLVMAKAVTGDFAEQVALIEDRVAKLEARGAG